MQHQHAHPTHHSSTGTADDAAGNPAAGQPGNGTAPAPGNGTAPAPGYSTSQAPGDSTAPTPGDSTAPAPAPAGSPVPAPGGSAPRRGLLPPRWFVRAAWRLHRWLLRVTKDRVGLSRPTPGGRFGMLRLRTVGRRSGQERAVVLGYVEDGDRLVTLAMNGWAPEDPAWWLNLQADPRATVDLVDGSREVVARAAEGAERERLWTLVTGFSGYGNLDTLPARRGRPTTVVVLESRAAVGGAL